MNLKYKKVLKYVLISLVIIITCYFVFNFVRVKTAKVNIILKKDLTIEFASNIHVSDMIKNMNGTIKNDYKIDTTKLGTKKIKFNFTNDDGITIPYSYDITIKDTTEPLIWLGNTYYVTTGSNIQLTDKILCGDNYDNKPICKIEGDYDLNQAGSYDLVFEATDKNGNINTKEFTLVVEDPHNNQSNEKNHPNIYTEFEDVMKTYKTKNTKIGIDISSFQGKVDFKKLKESGVEFVMIRVGGTRGIDTDYFIDEQFENNIINANKYGIDAGVYFYSYANSIESAKKDAKWVLKKIEDYKIDLPIAFDWENWKYYNDYHLSFFGLTSMAESFADVIEDAGYQGMIYSSKTYLENIWLPSNKDIWLAHYTDKTNYQGSYRMWQMCENGRVSGISNAVDIDILYLDND